MMYYLVAESEQPTKEVKMRCNECGRVRSVWVPQRIVDTGDLRHWRYLCCRCYGVGQMTALGWRLPDAPPTKETDDA